MPEGKGIVDDLVTDFPGLIVMNIRSTQTHGVDLEQHIGWTFDLRP